MKSLSDINPKQLVDGCENAEQLKALLFLINHIVIMGEAAVKKNRKMIAELQKNMRGGGIFLLAIRLKAEAEGWTIE